jgi:hypothetical protein
MRPDIRRFAIVSRSIVFAALLVFAATPLSAATSPARTNIAISDLNEDAAVTGVSQDQQVGLAWDAPADPGSSAITGYRVQIATSVGGVYADAAGCPTNSTTTSCTATGLTNGTQYFFKVAAINDLGTGPYSDPIGVTPGVVPSTPTAVAGVGGDQQVTVLWTAPAALVSPPLTGYQVQVATSVDGVYSDAAGCPTNSTTPSCTATGLTNATLYFFKVAGINSIGTGAYSTASIGVTPGILPGTPTGVAGVGGNQQVTVSWTAPASLGSPALTGYQVQVATSVGGVYTNAAGCATNSTTTSCTATGLTNGTQYFFKVAGLSTVGTGAYSTASSGVTPGTLPGTPTGVAGVRGNQQVSVSWTAPASLGSPALTGYRVQVATSVGGVYTNAAGCATNSTTPSCTATGLTNGTQYFFKVAGINTLGMGAYSTASGGVTPGTLPGTPTGVAGVRGNQQVSVSWTAPASLGSPALTGYQVQVATSVGGVYTNAAGCATNSATTSCTATGLTNGTPYFFKVAGINTLGMGTYSTASASVTPGVLPGTPTAVTGVAGNQQATVSWIAPASLGSPALTGYQVQVSTSVGGVYTNAAGCATNSTTPSCTATGLTNGTAYFFKVAGINSVGTGVYSAASNSVTPLATVFTDNPVALGGSMKRIHIVELRTAINAVRQVYGLSVFVFTDDPLVAGSTPIKAVHITQMRTALHAVYVQRGMTPPAYTDPSLATGMMIKAVHINQLRSAVLAVQ